MSIDAHKNKMGGRKVDIGQTKGLHGSVAPYIDDKVEKGGSITFETFHRQNMYLPE